MEEQPTQAANYSNLFNQGLALTANYTWSHTEDYLSATFGGEDERQPC